MALNSFVLMERLKKKYPQKDFMFALGSDLLPSLKSWPPINEESGQSRIWEETTFLGLPRYN